MFLHVVYASALVFATVFIHAGLTAAVLGWIRSLARHHWMLHTALGRAIVLGALVFLMSLAAWLEASLWAGFYWWVGAFPELADAHYFSLVTFTTLGYGDFTLDEEWRMLGAFEAANGIIMFGWTTALIVAAAQRLYFQREPDGKDS